MVLIRSRTRINQTKAGVVRTQSTTTRDPGPSKAHTGGEVEPTKGFHSSLKFSKLSKDAIQNAINQSAMVKIRTLKYYFQNLPTKENVMGLGTNWICEWSLVFTTHTHIHTHKRREGSIGRVISSDFLLSLRQHTLFFRIYAWWRAVTQKKVNCFGFTNKCVCVCVRVWQLYLDIQIFKYIGHKYLFGPSFVSNLFVQIYSDISSCVKM